MLKVIVCSAVLFVALYALTSVIRWAFAQSFAAGFVLCAIITAASFLRARAIDRSELARRSEPPR